MKKKFVVLEHLLLPDRGFRFFSTNTDNNTKLFDGRVAYKEVGFTDEVEEAQDIIRQYDRSKIATMFELSEYHKLEHHKSILEKSI